MLELERKEEGVVAVVVEDSMESEQRTIILFSSISPLDWEERERMGFFRNSGSGFLRY